MDTLEDRAIQTLASIHDFLQLGIQEGLAEVRDEKRDDFDRGVGQGKKDEARIILTLFGDDQELYERIKAVAVVDMTKRRPRLLAYRGYYDHLQEVFDYLSKKGLWGEKTKDGSTLSWHCHELSVLMNTFRRTFEQLNQPKKP